MRKYVKSIVVIISVVLSLLITIQLTNLNLRKIPYNGNLINLLDHEYLNENSLIDASNLFKVLHKSDVKIVKVISNGHDGQYIPQSLILNYNDIVTTKNGVSGLIADRDQIEKVLRGLGIRNDDTIVIYDNTNSPFATRLFWTLKVYGHHYVQILNGGLNAWINNGYNLGQPKQPTSSEYIADEKNELMIATIEDIKEVIKNKNALILDVRSQEEYLSGHIPNAINIHYMEALKEDGLFKSYRDLKLLYTRKGVTEDKEIYVYCTKGNRASFTYYVLHELLGYNNVVVYDGSFSEYAQSGLLIEK